MRKLIVVFIFSVLLFPVHFTFAEINAGFVQGIWFSRVPFFTNETITIYTAFQNNSGMQISGKVEFKDNESVIGSTDFSAKDGELIDASLDWKATNGNHTFAASLIEVKNEAGESIAIPSTVTSAENIFADNDTDGDRIGDKDDTESNQALASNITTDKVSNSLKNTHEKIGAVLGDFSEKVDAKVEVLEQEIKEEETINNQQDTDIATSTEPSKNIRTLTLALKKTEIPLLKGISYILKNQILFYFSTILFIFFIIWLAMKIRRRD